MAQQLAAKYKEGDKVFVGKLKAEIRSVSLTDAPEPVYAIMYEEGRGGGAVRESAIDRAAEAPMAEKPVAKVAPKAADATVSTNTPIETAQAPTTEQATEPAKEA